MLPRCLKVVQLVMGETVAENLVMFFGCGKLYIPCQPTAEFVDCLGLETTQRLCEYFGGWMVHIPDVSHIERNRRIWQHRHLGVVVLSERYGLRPRTIRKILKKEYSA